jgi:hypothetical protein
MLIKLICKECGIEFYRNDYWIRNSENCFCSQKCFRNKTITKKQTNCLQCGCEIHPVTKKQKFCSHSCSADYNNGIRYRENLKNILCLYCKKEFKPRDRSRKYCSKECSSKYRREKKIKDFFDGKFTDAHQVKHNYIRNYIIEKQKGVCSICGEKPFHNGKPLVFVVDHIDGNSENNNPKNIRAICPNCNSQTDTFAGRNVGKNKYKK